MDLDFNNICRVCLEQGSLKSIFLTKGAFGMEEIASCAQMMVSCASVTVSEEDRLPPQICTDCLTTLKIAYKFRKKCEASHELLINTLKTDEVKVKLEILENEYEDQTNHEPVDLVDIKCEDIKEEYPLLDDDNVEPLVEPIIEIKEGAPITNSQRLRKLQPQRTKSGKLCKKIKIDTKRYGYFIVTNQDDVGLEPDYLEALYKIYKHRCAHCPRIYAVSSYFNVHVNSHLGLRPYFCEICKKNFSDERSHLKYHKQRREKGAFRCQFCERAYNCEGSLRTHMKLHTGEVTWYPCSKCPKKFNQMSKLNNHAIVHTNNKNFVCQYCSKSFRFERNLKCHINSIHTNNRPHPCDSCPKSFTTTNELTMHKRRHLGIKNYHCSYCALSFVSSGEVHSHTISVHTKQKNYSCQYCGASFTRAAHRNKHETSQKCVLGQSFVIHNSAIPEKSHQTETAHKHQENYSCQYCGACFARPTHRNKHELSRKCTIDLSTTLHNLPSISEASLSISGQVEIAIEKSVSTNNISEVKCDKK